MKKTTYSTTVPATAGKNPATQTLAKSYLHWLDDPCNRKKYDTLGEALDKCLKRMLPDRKFGGWLSETEADIRQDTARELLNGFLAGNHRLRVAVRSRDLRKIARAVRRCMRTCLANNRKRTIEVEAAHKGTPTGQPTLESPSSKHELEYHMRSRISKMLSSATAIRELEKEEIRLLRMLVVDEATRDQAATELKKSHSWISNRLKKIKGKLQKSKALRRILEADM